MGVAGVMTATILGGRWDGHEVEYHGPVVVYKGETYAALRSGETGRVFYLHGSMVETWFPKRPEYEDDGA